MRRDNLRVLGKGVTRAMIGRVALTQPDFNVQFHLRGSTASWL
jgi:hypothetical protein